MRIRLVLATLVAALVLGERGRSGARVRAVRNHRAVAHARGTGSVDTARRHLHDALKTTGNTDGLQLTLTVHDRVVSRSVFDATLGDNPTFPQTLTLQPLSLDDYPADANGVRVVPVDLTRLNIRRSGNGVYPIEVQLRDANATTIAGFVTDVVVADLSAAAPKQLDVAWVWPLVAAPALALDGTPDAAVVSELTATGRLGRQAAVIAANTDVPLTLAPSPETLDAWLSLAQVQSRARRRRRRTAARSATRSGARGLVRAARPSLARRRRTRRHPRRRARPRPREARDVLQRCTSTRAPRCPATSTRRPSTRSATRPAPGSSSTAPPSSPTTVGSPPRARHCSGARAGSSTDAVTVLATDSGLENFLDGDAAPALRAAHLLSALAVIQGEQPSLARGGGVREPE